jgi:SPP1 gp7 family putative phage head morphogenesis protein
MKNPGNTMKNNPLKIDPTRTITLRKQFISDIQQRFRIIRKAVTELIINEDAFGIRADSRVSESILNDSGLITNVIRKKGDFWYVYSKKGRKLSKGYITRKAAARRLRQIEYFKHKQTANQITINTRWRFETDSSKLDAYRQWLQQQINAGILETVDNEGTPWCAQYITSAYRKGLIRSYIDTHKEDFAEIAKEYSFVEGGKESFLNMAFNSPIGQSKIKTLYTRAYSGLKGISADIDKEMSRILADGIAQGKGARVIAGRLNKALTTIEKKRAWTLARTEIIHAHAEGQLDGFERLGVEEVGVMAEWSTAGDDLVCPLCAPLEGMVLPIKEARGLIPRHPNCRCAWIPANVGEKKSGIKSTGKTKTQAKRKNIIQRKIKKSVKAEHPKLKLKEAVAASKWIGADINP